MAILASHFRLVFTLVAFLLAHSCVTSPPPAAHWTDGRPGAVPDHRYGACGTIMGRNSVFGARGMLQAGLLCRLHSPSRLVNRLRGGALPVRQGSTIEKEKPAENEVDAARYLSNDTIYVNSGVSTG